MNTPKHSCFKPTFCKSNVVSIFSYQNEYPSHGPQSPISSSLLSLSSEMSKHTGAPRYPSHSPQSLLSPSLLSLKSWRSEHTGAPWYPSSHSPKSPLFSLKSWRSEHTGAPRYPVTVPKAHSSLWSHGGLNTQELHDTQSQSPKPTLHSEVMAVWTHRSSTVPFLAAPPDPGDPPGSMASPGRAWWCCPPPCCSQWTPGWWGQLGTQQRPSRLLFNAEQLTHSAENS